MAAKMAAVPLPAVVGKRVLDIGCDFGAWTFGLADIGAGLVVGLDRGRSVRGVFTDLIEMNRGSARLEGYDQCRFERIDLGKQWHEFGLFDLILCLSMYHHWFECCGDHRAIWFWLSRHCANGAELLWEGPIDDSDPVVSANVGADKRSRYTLKDILEAAERYFSAEKIGPALHEPTREVWRFRPKPRQRTETVAVMQAGAGGATPAFEHENGRRIAEIDSILGVRPVAGSLNLRLEGPFDWDRGYFRAEVLDVKDRSLGINSEWGPRFARFYPLTIDGVSACAFRLEGERYDLRFMELIAPVKLRDAVMGPRVTLARSS